MAFGVNICSNTNAINHCNRLPRRDVPEANADAAGSGTSLQKFICLIIFPNWYNVAS